MTIRVVREIFRQFRQWFAASAVIMLVGILLAGYAQFVAIDRLLEVRREWAAFRDEMTRNPSASKIAVYEQTQRDLAAFAERVPRTVEFARVIGDLFRMAESNSLTVGGVSYTPGKEEGGYIDYSFSLDATGSYPGIKGFVSDLLTSREMVVIEQLSLSKTGRVFDDEVTVRTKLRMLFRQESKR